MIKQNKDANEKVVYDFKMYDHLSLMESLNLATYKIRDTSSNVIVYEIIDENDQESCVFFNTINHLVKIGDAEDDIYEKNLDMDEYAPHFSMLAGSIIDIKDITGDGNPEIIIGDVSNFRTDFQGRVAFYQVNELNELVQVNIPMLDINFIGGECEHINGSNSDVSFEGNKLKVVLQYGSYSCENQFYQERTFYYVWSEENEKFILESAT
ncbi:MAG: hypothetical protein AAF789_07015 [Bacteroidota bacterium]